MSEVQEAGLDLLPYEAIGSPEVSTLQIGAIPFHTVTWKASEMIEYKGRVIFVHGFGEHATMFTEFMDFLSQHGYDVFFFDQRGAGKTSPTKNLLGLTNEHYTFKDLDNMIEHNLKIIEEKPTKNLFLHSHSMGGGIVLNYGIHGKYRQSITGYMCEAPLILLHPKTKPNMLLERLIRVVCLVYPTMKFDTKLDLNYLTDNEGYRNYLVNDEMSKPIGTIVQLRDMILRGRKLVEKNYATQFVKDASVCIFHGEGDFINAIDGSEKFIELVSKDNPNRKLVRYTNAKHCIYMDVDGVRQRYFDHVLEFLDNHSL